jgi:hypothetical protein
MDADRFDSLARSLRDAASRRTIIGLLAGSTLGGALASPTVSHAAVRNRNRNRNRNRRKCRPCRTRKNGTCRGKRPNGTICGVDQVCRGGKCVSAGDPHIPGCSTSNDFCSGDQAACLGTPECGCFVTVESDTICGNLTHFQGCPAATSCTSSDDCHDVEFCVALPCCPEGKAVCVPLCVPPE